MATAMAQAPGNRRIKWERVQAAIDNVQAKEAELDEANEVLHSLMSGMFGEDGPNILDVTNTKDAKAVPRPTSSPRKPRKTRDGAKRKFVEQMFLNDNNATFSQIQDAWEEEGHDDTISNSLVYKIRRTLSESGQIKAETRRGRRPGVVAKREFPKSSTTQSRVVNDLEDTRRAIRDLAFDILGRQRNRNGLLLAEIVEILESEGMVPELPEGQDLGDILSKEMNILRESGKVKRGDNKVLHRVHMAEND